MTDDDIKIVEVSETSTPDNLKMLITAYHEAINRINDLRDQYHKKADNYLEEVNEENLSEVHNSVKSVIHAYTDLHSIMKALFENKEFIGEQRIQLFFKIDDYKSQLSSYVKFLEQGSELETALNNAAEDFNNKKLSVIPKQ